MDYSHKLHSRRSLRLKGYDYSSPGAYFVTISVHNRECLFGEIEGYKLRLNLAGQIVDRWWKKLPNKFSNIEIDEFVVMPNHFHGIIAIKNVGVQNFEPLQRRNAFQHVIPRSLGSVIRTYKSTLTRWCRINGHRYFKWQRNYYEHIIRDQKDLNKIREYIQNNPLKWHLDAENPKRRRKR